MAFGEIDAPDHTKVILRIKAGEKVQKRYCRFKTNFTLCRFLSLEEKFILKSQEEAHLML